MKQPLMLLRGCLVVELDLLNRIFPFRKLSIFVTRLALPCGLLQGFPVAFAEAGNRVVMLNPATDNYFHSRSWYIRDENFDLAYAKAGIK